MSSTIWKRSTLLFLMALLFTVNCAQKQSYKDLGAWSEKEDQSVLLAVRSIKKKKTKADVVVMVKNRYPFTIVIPENSIRLTMNGDEGTGAQNKRWVLKSGDTATQAMTFRFAEAETGAATMTLEHIYAGDTVTVKGVETNSETHSSAIVAGGRHIAGGFSKSNTNATAEGYEKKSALEGKQLPGVSLEIP